MLCALLVDLNVVSMVSTFSPQLDSCGWQGVMHQRTAGLQAGGLQALPHQGFIQDNVGSFHLIHTIRQRKVYSTPICRAGNPSWTARRASWTRSSPASTPANMSGGNS